MVEDVLIDGREYKAVRAVNLSLENKLMEHPVEEGFSISDEIIQEPIDILLDLILLEDRDAEYGELRRLRDQGKVIDVVCNFGAFNDMVVKSLSPVQTRSRNTYSCNLRLKQIRRATLKTKEIIVPTGATPPESEYNADSTAKSPSQEDVDDAPSKQQGKSWLESINLWVAGVFS
jgi:hypothetical protein